MPKINTQRQQAIDNMSTPPQILELLTSKYGPFDLDVAATESNAVCNQYYSPDNSGLHQEWFGRVFMHPPISKVHAWASKAYRERNNCEFIIALLPARTHTQWFHSYVYRKAALSFLKNLITIRNGAQILYMPHPYLVAVWRPDYLTNALQLELDLNV